MYDGGSKRWRSKTMKKMLNIYKENLWRMRMKKNYFGKGDSEELGRVKIEDGDVKVRGKCF